MRAIRKDRRAARTDVKRRGMATNRDVSKLKEAFNAGTEVTE